MGAPLWFDFSDARPAPAEIKAAGAAGVIRYLCYLPNPKVVTPAEYQSYRASGLDVRLVWEWTAGRVLQGAGAGAADAAEAVRQAVALGYKPGTPIYFAADQNIAEADFPTVAAYFHAAGPEVRASGFTVGGYGEDGLLRYLLGAGAITDTWQAGAATSWTGNATLDPSANLYQRAVPTIAPADMAGQVDEDVELHPDATPTTPGGHPVATTPPDQTATDVITDLREEMAGPGDELHDRTVQADEQATAAVMAVVLPQIRAACLAACQDALAAYDLPAKSPAPGS